MPISFPNSPLPGDQYITGSSTWEWNGSVWNSVISGTSGTSGLSTSGTSGTSGSSGSSGSSIGVAGSSGTSGTRGSAGTSGTGGTSGSSGTAGTSGVSTSGTSGASNPSGTSGTSGTLLSVATVGNNRVLTSDGTTGAVGEANLTFDGGTLGINGSVIVTGSMSFTGSLMTILTSSIRAEATSNTVDIFRTNYNQVRIGGNLALLSLVSALNFQNDSAAAAGGVPTGGLYRSGSFVLIRLI